MEIAHTSQLDSMAASQGLGQRNSNYPEDIPLTYSVVVCASLDDITVQQTQQRDTMLRLVKEAAKAGRQFYVYRCPLQADVTNATMVCKL